MAGTRSSTRKDAGSASNTAAEGAAAAAAGTKRTSNNATSAPKRSKKANGAKAEQKTIEETMPTKDEESGKPAEGQPLNQADDVEDGEAGADPLEEPSQKGDSSREEPKDGESKNEEPKNDDAKNEGQDGGGEKISSEGSAILHDPEREEAMPSSILEKGIIYFFFRARVGIEDPQGVQDVARSYIVLRPLPLDAKLGEGPLENAGNLRLLALPKKVLPVSRQDRFMVFVEKAQATIQDLNEVFAGADYETRTLGQRHTPAATPSGEGVYAITSTGRDSHLSYILTVPSKINEVQKELGLRERASFVASAKNPEVRGPANATLPNPAQFDPEILSDFRGRGWMPLQARLLDYTNAQILLIGEQSDDLAAALEPNPTDQKQHKTTPLDEMEQLEHEDDIRVNHLKGDDPVLADLGLSSADHAKLQTTW
ncbi:MAG: hypothetical protein M1826_006094 [Phylliscum demangeonii]|nr:MAG: hypothetical protein M1826_006094 [Phylliscum demangeonii]